MERREARFGSDQAWQSSDPASPLLTRSDIAVCTPEDSLIAPIRKKPSGFGMTPARRRRPIRLRGNFCSHSCFFFQGYRVKTHRLHSLRKWQEIFAQVASPQPYNTFTAQA